MINKIRKIFSLNLILLTSFLIGFIACKGSVEQQYIPSTPEKIVITSVKLENKDAKENDTILVNQTEADLIIVFAEKYEGLKVSVNGKPVEVQEKEATYRVEGLTTMESDITILAKAKNKKDKTYKFKAHLMSEAQITELKFIGENLNPSGTGLLGKKMLTYSSTTPPLLSDINKDGSTKIGVTKSFELEVWVMFYDMDAKERTLKVENTTNSKTIISTEVVNKTIQAKIPLKKGDNNLVITYSEKDKKPIRYSLVVEYDEPPYEPIYQIEIAGKYYSNKEAFDKLIAGTESINFEGASKLPVSVSIKENWYMEEGWNLDIDGKVIPKDSFEKTGSGSYARYRVETEAILNVNTQKEVKISFANPNREGYLKEYKITVNHTLFHKLKDLIVIDEKISKYIASNKFINFLKNKPNHFTLQRPVKVSDWASKLLFFLDVDNVAPKYAIFTQEKDVENIQDSEWQTTEKRTINYKQYNDFIEKEGYVAIENVEYGTSYLYILLEGEGSKIYYSIQIIRTKEKEDNVDYELGDSLFLNADDEGNILPNKHPLSTQGIAKIRPKNPRAKVKILEPEEKLLTLNQEGTYFEYTLPLIGKITVLKYKIIAENGIKESREQKTSFYKNPSVINVKFTYDKNAMLYNAEKANIKDGQYYIPLKKANVKENKIYLHLEIFKGLKISSNNLPTEDKITDNHNSTTYVYTLDVYNVLNGIIKDYEANLNFDDKNAGLLEIHLFKATEDIKGIKVAYFDVGEFPNNEYIFTKMMDANSGENIHVMLYKADGETKENTKQMVKVIYNSEERILEITREDNFEKSLYFTFKDLKLPVDQDAILNIKYYKDRNDSTTFKEYKLIINNRKE